MRGNRAKGVAVLLSWGVPFQRFESERDSLLMKQKPIIAMRPPAASIQDMIEHCETLRDVMQDSSELFNQ